ncbi:MAG: GC-type dockerin domain-anchored protein [Phycisphaerales bacterium]|nr:GC-type dockerin domain-anchored protein [Phycisphaerales bacterium]
MQSISTHTCAVLRMFVLGATFASSSVCSAQQVDYILDTGVGSFNIGPAGFDANVTWINSFDTVTGGELINNVSVSYGDIEDNSGTIGSDVVTLAILSDPNNDHDPSDAVLLSTTVVQWQDTGFGEFVDYPIQATQVEGVFFVAVVMDVLNRANPCSMDPNSPSAGTQSWLFYNPEENLNDLGSSPFILHMSESAFIGAWMVRATGEPAAQCIADITGDGQLNFFDVSAFLSLFAAQDSVADLNDDGQFNFFDISTFLTLFSSGCP